MSFDRLLYIDRLKEAGIDETVARAHAEALRQALSDTVATKADLKEGMPALRSDIFTSRSELKADMTDLRSEIKTEMAELRSEFKTEMAELRLEISALDRKIEITARDLTIRGASGLMVIASLIIGSKLFG